MRGLLAVAALASASLSIQSAGSDTAVFHPETENRTSNLGDDSQTEHMRAKRSVRTEPSVTLATGTKHAVAQNIHEAVIATEVNLAKKLRVRSENEIQAVTERWEIQVLAMQGCVNTCTTTTFANYAALKTQCLDRLRQPCVVRVIEATMAAPATVCGAQNAGVILPDSMKKLLSFNILSYTPSLRYNGGAAADTTCRTDRAVSYQGYQTNACTLTAGSPTWPATWAVDSTGGISFTNTNVDVALANGGSPALYIRGGASGSSCALAQLSVDAAIKFTGIIDFVEVPGNFFVAAPTSNTCNVPEACGRVFATEALLKSECLSKLTKDCDVYVGGRVNGDASKTQVCSTSNSVAYYQIPSVIGTLSSSYTMINTQTGLRYRTSNLAACNGVAATKPILAKVDKTAWSESLCSAETIKTPALAVIAEELPTLKNLTFYSTAATPAIINESDVGLALSSGPVASGCVLEAIATAIPNVYFEGAVKPEHLTGSALGFFGLSSLATFIFAKFLF